MFEPERLIVQVDNLEKVPFAMPPLRTEQVSLKTGDYCLKAAPEAAVIERKTVAELLGCIGGGRRRFEAELVRIRAFPARVVIVEGSWHDMLNDVRSQLTPASIAGTVAAWTARYCPFQFCGTREAAEDFARRFLFNVARQLWERAESFRQGVEG